MKLNKWVKENGKWSEYKCMKFMSDNKEKALSYINNYKNSFLTTDDYQETLSLVNQLEENLDKEYYIDLLK